MKVKGIICDICGESVYRHGSSTYKIIKRRWETEVFGKRLDICPDCWNELEAAVIAKRKGYPGTWIKGYVLMGEKEEEEEEYEQR